jgi:hypothetical protein
MAPSKRAAPGPSNSARSGGSGDSELAGTYSGSPRRPTGDHTRRAVSGAAKRIACAPGDVTQRQTCPPTMP